MDGLFSYAEIFATWVENLGHLWSFFNFNCLEIVEDGISILSSNPDASSSLALLNLIKVLIELFGFGDLTVLGLVFYCMGVGFGLYFAIVLVKWILNIFK